MAIIGFVTGTCSAVILYFQRRREQFALDCGFKTENIRSSPGDPYELIITVWVVNKGHAPVQIKEINWLHQHCSIKANGSEFEVKDTDIRWKLFDGTKTGFTEIRENQQKEIKVKYNRAKFWCTEHTYLEVVDVLDRRFQKPTGVKLNEAAQMLSK